MKRRQHRDAATEAGTAHARKQFTAFWRLTSLTFYDLRWRQSYFCFAAAPDVPASSCRSPASRMFL